MHLVTHAIQPASDDAHSVAAAVEEIAWMLWSSLGLIAHDGTLASRIDAVPPPALEHALNGGHNPVIGRYYAEVLTTSRALAADARILDFGCGYGRIALELIPRLTDAQTYVGLDPNAAAIEWAAAHLGAGRPHVTFERIDIASKPYNPQGELKGAEFWFPFDDDSLDLVFMISVLTHVDLPTVEAYIRETARVLKPETGRFVATFFLLDDDVDELIAAGKSTYRLRHQLGASRIENHSDPEAMIAHPRALVADILADAGFTDVAVRPGHWSGRTGVNQHDYQDLVIADLRPGANSQEQPTQLARELAVLREIAAELVGRGIRTREEVMDALFRALSVSVNAFWWHCSGLPLAPADPSAPAFAFAFDHCQEMGLADRIPTVAAAGGFLALGELDLLDHVREMGPRATRQALVDFFREAVHNEALVRTDDARFVFRTPGMRDRPAYLR